MSNIKIIGVGSFIPKRIVTSEDIDSLIEREKGWTEKHIKIKERRYADETVSIMAKKAIENALEMAGIDREEIGIICYTGVSAEQPLPSTACIIQKELEIKNANILTLDINASCISFITALDIIGKMMDRYKYAVIVSSEKGSECLNYKEPESSALFGDGAAAMIITLSEEKKSRIMYSKFKTYVEGIRYCEIYAGGSKVPPNLKNLTLENENLFKFHMNGPKVYKLASKYLPIFLDEFFEEANITLEDIDVIVPHQTSKSSLEIMRKKLKFPQNKLIDIIEKYGNMISASIPFAFACALEEGKIKRGDKVLLLGTAAGFSIGGLLIEY